ncbi:MAG TPA: hypothetical protein VGM02_06240 [Acidobacteriaceae bacterium]|jgi:hypothetical protein
MKATTNRQQNKRRNLEKHSADHSIPHSAISIFILFHLIAITCWAVPVNFAAVRDLREIIRPYMLWSGLYQSWDMFAPNPKSIDSYIKAVVFTQDRHLKVWTFPRMEELSFGERYQKERYRKFAEMLPDQKNELLWPGVAAHVARLFNNPIDPPDKVVLIEFRSDIKPGADESVGPVFEPNVFYEGYLDPGDLR